MNLRRAVLMLLLAAFLCPLGCAPPSVMPPRRDVHPLVRESSPEVLVDDMDRASLNLAVDTSIRFYERRGGKEKYCFVDRCFSGREMASALRRFREIVNGERDTDHQKALIRESFDFYRAAGRTGRGDVLVTGYFEPVLEGALEKTEQFRYPLYKTPEETVTVRLGLFRERYGKDRLVGRIDGREVVPHFSREDIDVRRRLADRGLEIAWLADPVDRFILHIQGSGKVRLPDGRLLRVNYDQSNGRPFRGLTTYMVQKGYLSEEEKGYEAMKSYLQNHPEIQDDIMNHNESYVFFRVVSDGPIGSLGLPIVPGRSIATDPTVFPRGGLAFLRSRKPSFDGDGKVVRWVPYGRFVLSHDAGGAIKGPGRLDLFCGEGKTAEREAGSLAVEGVLYFLAPKASPSP